MLWCWATVSDGGPTSHHIHFNETELSKKCTTIPSVTRNQGNRFGVATQWQPQTFQLKWEKVNIGSILVKFVVDFLVGWTTPLKNALLNVERPDNTGCFPTGPYAVTMVTFSKSGVIIDRLKQSPWPLSWPLLRYTPDRSYEKVGHHSWIFTTGRFGCRQLDRVDVRLIEEMTCYLGLKMQGIAVTFK